MSEQPATSPDLRQEWEAEWERRKHRAPVLMRKTMTARWTWSLFGNRHLEDMAWRFRAGLFVMTWNNLGWMREGDMFLRPITSYECIQMRNDWHGWWRVSETKPDASTSMSATASKTLHGCHLVWKWGPLFTCRPRLIEWNGIWEKQVRLRWHLWCKNWLSLLLPSMVNIKSTLCDEIGGYSDDQYEGVSLFWRYQSLFLSINHVVGSQEVLWSCCQFRPWPRTCIILNSSFSRDLC